MAVLQYRDVDGTLKDLSFPGEKGESAYEIAKRNGYSGTETDWLISLKGDSGQDKYSTTETAIGTWINGKTIYRKVYSTVFPAVGRTVKFTLPSGTSHVINLRSISWQGQYEWCPNGGYQIICSLIYYPPASATSPNTIEFTHPNANNGGVADWVGKPLYIIVDYIK